VAAAICLSPQALADPPAAQAAAHNAAVAGATRNAAVADAAHWTGGASTQLLGAWQAKRGQPASDGPSSLSWYEVRAGDSLSSIAGHFYHNPDAWTVVYWANRSRIRWANDIQPGQVLRIPVRPGRIPGAPALLEPSARPAPSGAAPASPESAAVTSAVPAATYSGGVPGGAFGQCVIARESGGQSQVTNATGHYGLYQFSVSTWAAYGGSPADFGDASVSEQNQVFANALAVGGQSNWSAYDGC
jgi:Transglycosylase-like domain/LysM domain